MQRTLLIMIVAVTICLGTVSHSEAMEAFLGGRDAAFKGDSTDERHKDWIDILSFGWGLTNASLPTTAPTGKPPGQFNVLTIEKFVDRASVDLAVACANGQHLSEAVLEITTGAPSKQLFAKVRLTDVLIASYGVQVPQGQTLSALAKPVEKVTFTFATIEWEAWPFDPKGQVGRSTVGRFDLKTSK